MYIHNQYIPIASSGKHGIWMYHDVYGLILNKVPVCTSTGSS